MSAIAGIFHRDGRPATASVLHLLAETLAHRGPDARAIWTDGGPVGLVDCLLWSTQESKQERLPLTSVDGTRVLVADARIDNRQELAAALGFLDRDLGEITDGQLILAAFDRWGENCPQKLLGDFAIAIWNSRNGSLFLARDPVGVKPLYIYTSPSLFAFGSEIKALLQLHEISAEIDEETIASFLAGLFEDVSSTFYRQVRRFPPSQSLLVTRDQVRAWKYWDIDTREELRLESDDQYAEAFLEKFRAAVQARLRSVSLVGSTLSGGMDSSSVTVVARRLLQDSGDERKLHTFSAIFPGLPQSDLPGIDERPFMDSVISTGGLVPHWIHCDEVSPLVDLERVIWHQDEPIPAANLYLHWAMYREAHQHGVGVLLDGLDGDTTVSHGLSRLTDLCRQGHWVRLMAESSALARATGTSSWEIIKSFALRPLIPPAVLRLRRILRRGLAPSFELPLPIQCELAGRTRLRERLRAQAERYMPCLTLRQAQREELRSPLMTLSLEIADKAAAAFSVEPRYPFFDRKLIEFCVSLPAQQKLSNGWTRIVLRRSMAALLPDKIRWRTTKGDLSANLRQGLLERQCQYLDDLLTQRVRSIPRLEEFVDLEGLQKQYASLKHKPTAWGAFHLYRLVSLAAWLACQGKPRPGR